MTSCRVLASDSCLSPSAAWRVRRLNCLRSQVELFANGTFMTREYQRFTTDGVKGDGVLRGRWNVYYSDTTDSDRFWMQVISLLLPVNASTGGHHPSSSQGTARRQAASQGACRQGSRRFAAHIAGVNVTDGLQAPTAGGHRTAEKPRSCPAQKGY